MTIKKTEDYVLNDYPVLADVRLDQRQRALALLLEQVTIRQPFEAACEIVYLRSKLGLIKPSPKEKNCPTCNGTGYVLRNL